MQQRQTGLKAQSGARSRRGGEIPRRPFTTLVTCLLIDFFEARDLIGLGTLAPLDDVELNFITLFEALIALALDGTVMYEYVCPALAAEEAVPLCVIEPLYGAFILCHWSHSLIRL